MSLISEMSPIELSGFKQACRFSPRSVIENFEGKPDYILVTRGRIDYTSMLRLTQAQSEIKQQFGIGSKLVAVRSKCVYGEFKIDDHKRIDELFDLAFFGKLDDIAYQYSITRMKALRGNKLRRVDFIVN